MQQCYKNEAMISIVELFALKTGEMACRMRVFTDLSAFNARYFQELSKLKATYE